MSITYEELSKHPIMDRPAILYAAFAEILPRQPELFTGPASDAGLRDTVNLLMGFSAGLADNLGMAADEFHTLEIIRNAEKALNPTAAT